MFIDKKIWIVIAAVVIALLVLYLWPKSVDGDITKKLTTEQVLLKQNQELLKQLLDEKDKTIQNLESRIAGLDKKLDGNTVTSETIKKIGHEKITRIATYDTDSILKYLSDLERFSDSIQKANTLADPGQ